MTETGGVAGVKTYRRNTQQILTSRFDGEQARCQQLRLTASQIQTV